MSDCNLALLLTSVCRLTDPSIRSLAARSSCIGFRFVLLLVAVVHLLLRLLENVLSPQVEEVVRIGVELEAVLAVVSVHVELIKGRRLVARLISF